MVSMLVLSRNEKNKRWVLLEHKGAPEDPLGLHYDLLLEDEGSCRTWRLSQIPTLNSQYVEAIPVAPHNLSWLKKKEGEVSGGRGTAKRLLAGVYVGDLPKMTADTLRVFLKNEALEGCLEITGNRCLFTSTIQ